MDDNGLQAQTEEDEGGDGLRPDERKLITQSYDMSVATLLDQWNEKTLLIPEIQREYVWDNAKASRLIESLLLNIPIPVIYVAEAPDDTYEVIDGHQRIRSIARFVNNEFGLSGLRILNDEEHSRKKFYQLSPGEQRRIKGRVIREIIITEDSHPSMRFEIFERLNTGSVALNAQEIRNSTHRGPFMDMVKKNLVRDPNFRKCIGSTSPRKRMVDEELAIRCLAIREGVDWYRPPVSRFLNDFCAKENRADAERREHLRISFERGMRNVVQVFGKNGFRLTDSQGERTERNINTALADAQFSALVDYDTDTVAGSVGDLVTKLGEVHASEEFLDDIRRATSDRARTVGRLERYRAAVRAVLGDPAA